MSVRSEVTCDRCGTLIESRRSRFRADCGPASDRWPEGIDLCPGCLDALGSWLDEGVDVPSHAQAIGDALRRR